MTTEVKAAATKSLGEKLFDAVIFASDQSHDWSALPSDIQIRFEQSATIFAAEALSQATEENERLRGDKDNLIATQMEEVVKIGLARDSEREELTTRATKAEAEGDEALEALSALLERCRAHGGLSRQGYAERKAMDDAAALLSRSAQGGERG